MNWKLLELQSKYIETFNNDPFIFPDFWFDIEDQDKLKIEILTKAIQQKELIIDVKGGQYFVEQVKTIDN